MKRKKCELLSVSLEVTKDYQHSASNFLPNRVCSLCTAKGKHRFLGIIDEKVPCFVFFAFLLHGSDQRSFFSFEGSCAKINFHLGSEYFLSLLLSRKVLLVS